MSGDGIELHNCIEVVEELIRDSVRALPCDVELMPDFA
jgi:hypothetical protein